MAKKKFYSLLNGVHLSVESGICFGFAFNRSIVGLNISCLLNQSKVRSYVFSFRTLNAGYMYLFHMSIVCVLCDT